ncbi:MAG: selenium metabolism-associated LysR family transcriptional regulator [Bacillota bacterium]
MKLKTLKMFVKLIQANSFSIVAEQLDLTQPAVSMQIKSLEKKFDTELFTRENNKFHLTPAGRIVYNQAQEILEKWDNTRAQVKQIKQETYGQLTIGASTIPSEYLLPDLLAKFYTKLPEVEVTMKIKDSQDILKLLTNREVDLAIMGYKPQDNRLQNSPIVEDHLTLIVSTSHQLANQQQITSQELTKEKILIREKGSGTRKAMLTALKQANINQKDLNIRACLDTNQAIISAVEAELGIAFISHLAAKKAEANNRIKTVKLKNIKIDRKFYLAYHTNRNQDLLIKKFVASC